MACRFRLFVVLLHAFFPSGHLLPIPCIGSCGRRNALTAMRRIVLLFIVLLSMFSCRDAARQEALHTVAVADSLFAAGGLLADTCRLQQAIDVLERHACLDHDALARAYYYLGRNYDLLHMDSREVPCFIRCIKLRPKDPQYAGRAYCNMVVMSEHVGELEIADYMMQKALVCFRNTDDSILWLEGEVRHGDIKRKKGDYPTCKAVLDGLQPYADNAGYIKNNKQYPRYRLYYYNVLARYYSDLHQYDSALWALRKVEHLTCPLNYYMCTRDLMFCEVYKEIGKVDSSMYFARRIIEQTEDSRYLTSAYNISLGEDAASEVELGIELSEVLSVMKERFEENTQESRGYVLVKEYYTALTEKKYHWLYGILTLLFIIGAMAVCVLYLHRKKYGRYLSLYQIKKQIRQAEEERKTSVEKRCMDYLYANSFSWKDYKEVRKRMNVDFYGLADKLETEFHLSEKEIKLCCMVMIGYSKAQIADKLCIAVNSVGNSKLRVARKMGKTMVQMQDFLKKMACKPTRGC